MLQSPKIQKNSKGKNSYTSSLDKHKIHTNMFVELAVLRKYFNKAKGLRGKKMCDIESPAKKNFKTETNTDSDYSLTSSPCPYENEAIQPKKISTSTNTEIIGDFIMASKILPDKCIKMTELSYLNFPVYGIQEECIQVSMDEENNLVKNEEMNSEKMGDIGNSQKNKSTVQQITKNHHLCINSILKEDGKKV